MLSYNYTHTFCLARSEAKKGEMKFREMFIVNI